MASPAPVCPRFACIPAGGNCTRPDDGSLETFCAVGTTKWSRGTSYPRACTCIAVRGANFPVLGTPCDGQEQNGECGPEVLRACQPTAAAGGFECRGLRSIGDPCTNDLQCRYPRVCTGGLCTASRASGSACGQYGGCALVQFCKQDTCQDYQRRGETCNAFGNPCQPGLRCVNGTVCGLYYSLPNGAIADNYADCHSGVRDDLSHQCIAAPLPGSLPSSCSEPASDQCGPGGQCQCPWTPKQTDPPGQGECALRYDARPSWKALVAESYPLTTQCEMLLENPLNAHVLDYTPCLKRINPDLQRRFWCVAAEEMDTTWYNQCAGSFCTNSAQTLTTGGGMCVLVWLGSLLFAA